MIHRYGLRQNPFERTQLDRLPVPGHAELLVKVDGFKTQAQEIEQAIKDAVQNNTALFFVIAGESGAGRSSVADHILMQYSKARQFPPGYFIAPTIKVKDFQWKQYCRRWAEDLEEGLEDAELDPDERLKEKLKAARSIDDDQDPTSDMRGLARQLQKFLEPHGGGLGACFEDVQTHEIIDLMFEVFRKIPGICIFTVLDSAERRTNVLDWYVQQTRLKDSAGSKLFIELSELAGEDARELIEERWKKFSASPGVPTPFDPDGLRLAFSKPMTIALILSLCRDLLELKIAMSEPDHIWPQDQQMRLSKQNIIDSIKLLRGKLFLKIGGGR